MTGITEISTPITTNWKIDFEKALLLAFHALQSIVGNKTFQKADNKLLWSRMDGKVKAVHDVSELSEN